MCTAIVEPLAGPGAIGNALKSLRDPQRALRSPSEAIPKMTPVAAGLRPQLHRIALPVRVARAGRVQPQQCRDSRTAGHPGRAVSLSRELLVPYHDVAKAEHHFAALQPMVEFGARIPDRVVDGDELRRIAPAITDHIRAGLVMPGDRSIDPRRLSTRSSTSSNRERSHRRTHRVTGVESSGDRVRSLTTTSGTIDGEEFVLSAGAGSRQVAKHFDLHLSVIPGQGYNVALPTSPGLQQPVIFEEVHAVATPFEDRIRLGGTMEFGGDHPPFDGRPAWR